ncbi:hypothetical protein CPB86DRAFT_737705 [Serendipita vermifera]|nr:hypothetical protein CPB86DRAFT_737705 [Serendipita vermifera]
MKIYKATPSDSHDDNPILPIVSSEFPEDYGDAKLKSSDGVLFHFPSFLLSYVSPVFGDMYQLGESAKNEEILSLTESYATLECLLRHIDPLKDTPPLDWNRVEGLLAAAEKYQITSVFRWFEREAALALTAGRAPDLPNPVFCLALATRYDLNTTARLALRQLIKCPVSEIRMTPYLDGRLFEHLLRLRTARAQWLAMVVLNCDGHKRQCWIHPDRFWAQNAIQAVIHEPSWAALVSSIENELVKDCQCRGPQSSTYWTEKAKELEDELPELDW